MQDSADDIKQMKQDQRLGIALVIILLIALCVIAIIQSGDTGAFTIKWLNGNQYGGFTINVKDDISFNVDTFTLDCYDGEEYLVTISKYKMSIEDLDNIKSDIEGTDLWTSGYQYYWLHGIGYMPISYDESEVYVLEFSGCDNTYQLKENLRKLSIRIYGYSDCDELLE